MTTDQKKDSLISAKEQGCSLDELTRLQILKTMGIQVWFSKQTSLEKKAMPEPVITQAAPQSKTQAETQAVVSEPNDQLKDNNNGPEDFINIGQADWQQLESAVSQCQLCELHTYRSKTVFGVGNKNADLMIIGDAPEAKDEETGEAFVDEAGVLLDAMLKAIELDRQQVFISNAVKCRPPEDRKPHTSEIVCCDLYLQRQIELIQPKLILALGRVAAQHLLLTKDNLSDLRQRQHSYNGIPLMVSFHPAYLLKKPSEKRKAWQDLQQIQKQLQNF